MPVNARKKTPAPANGNTGAEASLPLHIQIREAIRRQVRDGELIDETGRLMTEAELGRHFGVSRITIRNAIAPLVNEGMFARSRGTLVKTIPAFGTIFESLGRATSYENALNVYVCSLAIVPLVGNLSGNPNGGPWREVCR